MNIPLSIRKNLITIASTCVCFVLFGIYGWFEFTDRAEAFLRFAKEWTGIGANYTAETIQKFDSKYSVWPESGTCREIGTDEKLNRFAVASPGNIDNITLCRPKYLEDGILLPRVLNEIERRYTNSRYKALIIDLTGYVPTGADRLSGASSVRSLYTGDKTQDDKNWSFRFFPYHSEMDRIINSVFETDDGTGYAGSQIIVDGRVWGYFIISFDMHIIKVARFEIVRRIFLICLIFGCTLSVFVERIKHDNSLN